MQPSTPKDDSSRLDVQAFIDNLQVSRFQLQVVLLCFVVVAIDGFDTAAIGFIGPALRSEWSLTANALSPVMAAALVGLMLGSFFVGPLADRFGRKRLLLASMVCFGLMSVGSALAHSVETLAIARLLTGLGLGAAMPNAITLTSEYCPSRRRALMIASMFCGFTLGSALGGVIAAQLLPHYGWRSVLMLGGLMPLALAPVLWLSLPESVRFMVVRQWPSEQIGAVLQRIARATSLRGVRTFYLQEEGASQQSSLRTLLVGERRFGTLMLWLSFAMSLLVIYLLTNWLPILLKDSGYKQEHAAWISSIFQIGGTFGAIGIGRCMDRFRASRVLAVSYAIGSLCIFGIGYFHAQLPMLGLCIFGVGVCISGSQVGMNALAAAFYPTSARTTGISSALGAGRLGGIAGSFLGGGLLAQGMGFSSIFTLLMLPALLASACVLLLHRRYAHMAGVGATESLPSSH